MARDERRRGEEEQGEAGRLHRSQFANLLKLGGGKKRVALHLTQANTAMDLTAVYGLAGKRLTSHLSFLVLRITRSGGLRPPGSLSDG